MGLPWPWLFTGADAVRIANGHAALVPRYAAPSYWRILLARFLWHGCRFTLYFASAAFRPFQGGRLCVSTSIARSSADTDRLLRLVQPFRIVSFLTLAQHSQCAGRWQL